MTWSRTAFCAFVLVAGCAHAPSAELVDARRAYEQASAGPARDYNPGGIYVVSRSLQRAEREFEAHGNSEHARNLAYVATHKAMCVAAHARAAQQEDKLASLERGDLNLFVQTPAQLVPRPAQPVADSRELARAP